MAVSDIRIAGRATQGVRLINIKDGDSIAAVSAVNKSEDDAPQAMPQDDSSEAGQEGTPEASQEGTANHE